jgi:hypothetical protein
VIEVNGEIKVAEPKLQRTASASSSVTHIDGEFDFNAPLDYCTQILAQNRKAQNRPESPQQMTQAQLKEERVVVKRLLRQFDAAFKERTGQLVCSLLTALCCCVPFTHTHTHTHTHSLSLSLSLSLFLHL